MEVAEVFRDKSKKKEVVINNLAPHWPFRAIYCGRSGSGKTNALLSMVSNHIPWQVIAVYARHLDNAQYTGLREKIQKWEEKHDKVVSVWSDKLEDLQSVNDVEPTQRKLIVIDDFLLEKDQSRVVEYFVSGRHKNCSIIYVSQAYFRIPKTIRDNATHLACFRGMNGFDRSGIWKDACATMKKEQFEDFYNAATKDDKYGFIFVDRDAKLPELTYRIGYDELYIPLD